MIKFNHPFILVPFHKIPAHNEEERNEKFDIQKLTFPLN